VNKRFPHVVAVALACFVLMPAHAEPEGITTGKMLQAQAEARIETLTTEALKKEIDGNPDLVLIDIRMPSEIEKMGGQIDATQNENVPRGWLEHRVTRLAQSKDTPIVVYCGAGVRSPLAAQTLMDMGYTNVRDYPAGFLAWREAGLAVK